MTETSAPAEVVQTPSWPPTEAQLNEWLATIVEAWWSAASATYIRSGKLQATDIKAKYALREIIRPWAEAAHQATRIQPLAADALDAGIASLLVEWERLENAFHEALPGAQGETGDGGIAGRTLCQFLYDNSEKLRAALSPGKTVGAGEGAGDG